MLPEWVDDSYLHYAGLVNAGNADVLVDLLVCCAGLEALDHGGLGAGQQKSEGSRLGLGLGVRGE